MSISVKSQRISADTMEVVFETAMPLKPGQIIAFTDGQENHPPVYAVIDALKSLDEVDDASRPTRQMARLSVLYGEPSLSITGARIIDDAALLNHVMQLLPEADYPVQLGAFSADIRHFGTATFIQDDELENGSSAFDSKRAVLEVLMGQLSQYQRVLVIDPLGLFVSEPGQHVLRAGLDTRLSIAHLGAKRISEALEQHLPSDVLRAVSAFFSGALAIGTGTETGTNQDGSNAVMSLNELMTHANNACPDDIKAVVTSCLTQMQRTGVFADKAEQVFSSHQLPNVPVTVLDVSGLSEPWKTLFYHWATSQFLQTSGGDVVSVLIYPENYMPQFDTWLRKVNEADLMTFVLSSPYMKAEFRDLADTTLDVNDDVVHLHGDITCHLPVAIPMASLGLDAFDDTPDEAGLTLPNYDEWDGDTSPVKISRVEHDPDSPDISGLTTETPTRAVGITDMFEDDLDTPAPPLADDGFGDDHDSYFDSILGGSLTEETSEKTLENTLNEATDDDAVLLADTDADSYSDDALTFALGDDDDVMMSLDQPPSTALTDSVTLGDDEASTEPDTHSLSSENDHNDDDDDDDFFFDIDLDKKIDDSVYTNPTSDTQNLESVRETQIETESVSNPNPNPKPEQASGIHNDDGVSEHQRAEAESSSSTFGFDDIPVMDDFGSSASFGGDDLPTAPLFDDTPKAIEATASEQESLPKAVSSATTSQPAPDKNQSSSFGQSLQEQLMAEQRAMYGDAEPSSTPSPTETKAPVASTSEEESEVDMAPFFDDHVFDDNQPGNQPDALQSADPVTTREHAPSALGASEGFANTDKANIGNGNGDEDMVYQVGDAVYHPDHGQGVVSRVMPMEQGVVLNITFESVGKRIMDPKLVPLEKR